MKTITIRLPDVEAAMLVEVQKRKRIPIDLQKYILDRIRVEYQKCCGV